MPYFLSCKWRHCPRWPLTQVIIWLSGMLQWRAAHLSELFYQSHFYGHPLSLSRLSQVEAWTQGHGANPYLMAPFLVDGGRVKATGHRHKYRQTNFLEDLFWFPQQAKLEWGRERKIVSFIFWFTPQVAVRTMAGHGWSQELGMPFGSPKWVAGVLAALAGTGVEAEQTGLQSVLRGDTALQATVYLTP